MNDRFQGRILYVPGKNPKPDPLLHCALLWRAIHTGLRQHQPDCADAMSGSNFELAAWNRQYYGRDKDAMPDFEAIERLLAGRYDEQQDRCDADTLRVRTERLARVVADRFPRLIHILADRKIKDTIAETARYFDRQESVGVGIRELVKHPLRNWLEEGRPVLVIGHSLGSVIAWDALWELTHKENLRKKLDFISMGSPLGIHYTQTRLLGSDCEGKQRYPRNLREWHNLAAVGDLIALDPTIADDFSEMLSLGLVDSIEDHYAGLFTHYRDEGGLNPHRSFGYLVHDETAARIAAWWWRNR